jgi:hypothetical protein
MVSAVSAHYLNNTNKRYQSNAEHLLYGTGCHSSQEQEESVLTELIHLTYQVIMLH